MKTLAMAIFSIGGLSACAYNQSPVVDLAGKSQQQYQHDYAYCESFSAGVDKGEAIQVSATNEAAGTAVIGAVAGAFEDGIEGAIGGAIAGALIGSITGGIHGATVSTEVQAQVLRTCLADHGYAVYDRKH